LDVMLGIEPALYQLPVVLIGLGRERQKAQKQPLIPRLLSFQEQGLHMVRQLIILVPVIAANMLGDQLVLVIDQETVRKPF